MRAGDKGAEAFEHQISCGDHEKGLVGGFDLTSWLGMDPRLKTRAYKTYGNGGAFALVCFADRLGTKVR